MRWNNSSPVFEQPWIKWFAWFPVYLGYNVCDKAWLENVERKKVYWWPGSDNHAYYYSYREITQAVSADKMG